MKAFKTVILKSLMKTTEKPRQSSKLACLKRTVILFSLFGSLSVFAQVCLSPLEMAALFSTQKSGSTSTKGKINQLNKDISKLERDIEKIEEKIREEEKKAEEPLENFVDTLNEEKLNTNHNDYAKYDPDDYPYATGLIENYVKERSNKFNGCPSSDKATSTCYAWQLTGNGDGKSSHFKRGGEIDPKFCDKYAVGEDVGECRDNLEKALEAYKELEDFKKKKKERITDLEKIKDEKEDDMEMLEDEDFNASLDGEEEETEASGLCLKCLAEVRRVTGPSGGQRLGSGLAIALGAGLSYFGLRESRRAQASANEMLALQGFPAENNFGYNMAGLSLGFPLISQGIYGLGRGGMSKGGYGCSSTASPYPSMNPMMQMQYQSMTGGGGGPWGAMNPAMQQYQAMMGGGNQWGMNPAMMQYQSMMGGGGNQWGNPAMMQYQSMMGGGNQWGNPAMMQYQAMMGGGNQLGMMNPMMGTQFQSMSPWGTNPMMQSPGHNPWMGGNSWGVQQMQAQMQFRMQQQQAWMAQQQIAYQKWMQKQQLVGELSQQLMQIRYQLQMVMAGGTTNFASSTTSGFLGTPGTPGFPTGGPTHTPLPTTPNPTGTNDPPIEWRQ